MLLIEMFWFNIKNVALNVLISFSSASPENQSSVSISVDV
jgi:hypothetical protein